jgi:type IV pilus assembly protein PilV
VLQKNKIYLNKQQGFTLIEVLVSIVIVAFGLLGAAGLIVKGASLGVSAHNRTLATQKIYEMVDRMRLNMEGVRSGKSVSPPTGTFTCASECSSAEMAKHDSDQWQQGLVTALGASATGQVALNSGRFTITVTWREKNLGLNNFTDQSYSLDVQL